MLSDKIVKQNIEDALKNFHDEPLPLRDAAMKLLNTLGYYSGYVSSDEIDKPRYDHIKEAAEKTANPIDSLCINDWEPFSQVMQVTDAEINAQLITETKDFESKPVNNELRSSYMFIAIPLTGETYTRTQLANIMRFMSMRIPQPFMVMFRYGSVLTLGIINRRHSKRNENKQVLEKVTLIKDIVLDSPKRAHIEIVYDLYLRNLIKDTDKKVHNFDTLHEAWEVILNTEELNKRFYNDLEEWYDWAITACKFPDKENKMQVIRMLTRILFIWFLKEKNNLVPSDIFTEDGAKKYLNNFHYETSDYYQAILQNLFFATLNTPITEREFRIRNETDTTITEQDSYPEYNEDHRNSNKYRYEDLIQNPKEFLQHLKQAPFVNGGLFDSLDSFEGKRAGGKRVDCFTDWPNHRKQLRVPAKLFFEEEKGLYNIFKNYKFTVEENTPVDQEVALDPELLGQVFENLLGVYNPETEDLARKETGSFYTRRNVVDYMVDEALIAYFLQKVAPGDGDTKFLEERLRDDLLAYDQLGEKMESNDHMIYDSEIEPMIQAVDDLKILDPAVGSGAFPMGILNKLVLILKKLDPENEQWMQQQIDQADKIPDPHSRDAAHKAIAEVFSEANQYNNYGRKLYLIQNSIYGVDIQPIAVTIAKLRFFISLVIEQKPNENADDNYGIRPLPNLETKFVAANTLIGLNKLQDPELQKDLFTDTIQELQNKIETIRVKYFSENKRDEKLQLIKDEKDCRDKLEKALDKKYDELCNEEKSKIAYQVNQLPNKDDKKQLREKLEKEFRGYEAELTKGVEEAKRIVKWDLYDQNDNAEFFDPEWMFGIKEGFDITIGNPPYVRADAGKKNPKLREWVMDMREQIKNSKQYETLYEKWDLFIPFIERSYKLLKPSGFTTLIVSDAYCHAKYAQVSQNWILKFGRILRLDFCSKVPLFGSVGVRNTIFLFQQTDGSDNKPERRVHIEEFGKVQNLSTDEQQKLTHRTFFAEDPTIQQFTVSTITLDKICYISSGMEVQANEKKAQGTFGVKDVVSNVKDATHPEPYIEGKHIEDRWLQIGNKWLEWGTERAPALFRGPRFPELFKVKEKLITNSMSAALKQLRVVYDNQQLCHNHTAWSFVTWHTLEGIRNLSIQKQARYHDEKQRPNMHKREEVEIISRCYSMKFLIGVMNSNCARDFLQANRTCKLNLYPKDWKQLPIPDVSPEQQEPVVALVDKILDAKRKGFERKVSRLEKKLDKIVSMLYGVEDTESDE